MWYLRNRKHVPCFYRVIQTRLEVWENEKCCGNTSRRRVSLFQALGSWGQAKTQRGRTSFLALVLHHFFSRSPFFPVPNYREPGTGYRRVFPQLFRVLPNFHECLYNSIETRSTCFLFLLENNATRKRKTTC